MVNKDVRLGRMNEKLKKGLTILLGVFLGIVIGIAGAAVMSYLFNRKMEKMGLCPCCGRRLG